jgi:CubicO group peptidase (beta-lactamase class C family)
MMSYESWTALEIPNRGQIRPMLKRLQRLVLALAITLVSAFVYAQQKSTPVSPADRIHRVESGFAPIPMGENAESLQLGIPQLMEVFKVPGLSIAVIDNYQIAWANGYGVTDIGTATPVTTKTLFQAGSISKPVAAVGALYLVEKGKLSLDEDVNKKLVTWKVPENEFTKEQKVTLRRLQSHSAGLTVHGFPGYATDQPIPALVQIFNGEKPANTAPIRVDFIPGTRFRYSGGGVTIEQQLMIDVTGKPFPQFMRETVLDKIGMKDSTYEQPLPPARAMLAATGTYSNGKQVRGKWHVYPEMAAAGLWTTPSDLARFAIEIALSKNGKANHVLSQATVREMLKPQIEHVGLGFFLGDEKNPDQFGHDGADEGFQALLIMFSDSGQGVAIMGNSDSFFRLTSYLVESIAKEYGWKYTPGKRSASDALLLVEATKGIQAAIDEYSYFKKAALPQYQLDENTLNGLGYYVLSQGRAEDAIRIFKFNVQEYPNFWNCYDSLGEAYMQAGQKELAIQSYEKSIQLNPKNENGIEILKKLREASH